MATQNAQRMTRETESPSVERFRGEQSLAARVQRGRIPNQAANDNEPVLERTAANDNAVTPEISAPARAGSRVGNIVSRRVNPLTRMVIGLEYGVASVCAYMQFWLGLTAIVFVAIGFYDGFFGLSGDQLAAFGATTIGSAALGGVNLVGSLFGFHVMLPPISFTAIGLASWGITLIFTLLGYAAVALMLRMEDIDVFATIELMLLSLTMLALDLIFITQLFPWILVWIFLVHVNRLAGNPL